MTTYGWGGCIYPHFLHLGGSWRWVVSFTTPAAINPGKGAPGTLWIGGCVDPRTGLDDLKTRKFLTLPGLELQPLSRPADSQSLYRLQYPGSKFITKISLNFPLLEKTLPSTMQNQIWSVSNHHITENRNLSIIKVKHYAMKTYIGVAV
jgi:hypothetical protein